MCKNYIWMRCISEISFLSSVIRDALRERRGATATATATAEVTKVPEEPEALAAGHEYRPAADKGGLTGGV